MKRIKILHPVAKLPGDPRRSAVARLVKIDCPHLPAPFTYNSIYHRGSVVGPRQTGEQDCRGLRAILCRVSRLVKKT